VNARERVGKSDERNRWRLPACRGTASLARPPWNLFHTTCTFAKPLYQLPSYYRKFCSAYEMDFAQERWSEVVAVKFRDPAFRATDVLPLIWILANKTLSKIQTFELLINPKLMYMICSETRDKSQFLQPQNHLPEAENEKNAKNTTSNGSSRQYHHRQAQPKYHSSELYTSSRTSRMRQDCSLGVEVRPRCRSTQ